MKRFSLLFLVFLLGSYSQLFAADEKQDRIQGLSKTGAFTYAKVGGWKVQGYTKLKECWIQGAFQDKTSFIIGSSTELGNYIIVEGIRSIGGKDYSVDFKTSIGANFTLNGLGLQEGDAVLFSEIPSLHMVSILRSQQIEIQGLGKFQMEDVPLAVDKMWDCREIL